MYVFGDMTAAHTSVSYHVGHVVKSWVFPVGGGVVRQQTISVCQSVCVRETAVPPLGPSPSRRAPPPGRAE